MPEFTTPFAGNNLGRKFTKEELIRATRFNVAAEFEAAQLYEQVVNATDDEKVKAVYRDIINEELVHAGQFLKLVEYLSPEDEKLYKKGYKEDDELFEKVKKGKK
jgi:rubrerythrin